MADEKVLNKTEDIENVAANNAQDDLFESTSADIADDNIENIEKKAVTPALSDEEEKVYDDEGQAKWYVVHTYSGHENKVKANIEKIVKTRGMDDLVLEIIVPTEDHIEIKDGQRKVKTKKMFPGYVLVKMIVTNESWYLVRNTQGVTGFVGHGSKPVPLTKEEVRRMGIEKVYIDLDINVGDRIKVINGPFESFMGEVEEVNEEKQMLKARISMFGRDTPVELVYDQVDKVY